MNTHLTWSKVGRKWDPVLGMGQVVHGLVQHITLGGGSVYPPLNVTFGHVIHKLVQHISTEGGSEQEGNLSFKFYSIKVCNICYLASIFCMYMIGNFNKKCGCHH